MIEDRYNNKKKIYILFSNTFSTFISLYNVITRNRLKKKFKKKNKKKNSRY